MLIPATHRHVRSAQNLVVLRISQTENVNEYSKGQKLSNCKRQVNTVSMLSLMLYTLQVMVVEITH